MAAPTRSHYVSNCGTITPEDDSRGREDARKGRPVDPTAHRDYLKATSQAYSEAFMQGYNELYRAQVGVRRDGASE